MAPQSRYVLSIKNSDGTPATHPTNTTKPAPAADGSWDYFRPIGGEEQKSLLWRSKAAEALAEKYIALDKRKGKSYIFKELPTGYKLFEHIKGKKDGEVRKDTYLFGHPNGSRFRSAAEFTPHLLHLASKAPEHAGAAATENFICTCKYCGVSARTPGTASRTRPSGTQRIIDHETARRDVALEERLGEQETVGWVLRKGELAWVWMGPENELLDVDNAHSEQWAVGVVVEKPAGNPPFRLATVDTGSLADINMGDAAAPWQDNNQSLDYIIQLCTEGEEPGMKHRAKQHSIRPWLARPDFISPPASYTGRKEHPSVAVARKIARTFSLFEKVGIAEPPDDEPDTITTIYNGLFLGAEKIFVSEPVRIANPQDPTQEEVLVVENIYVVSSLSSSKGTKPRTSTIRLSGSVYYLSPDTLNPLTPVQFAQLPWRMRRKDPKTHAMLNWCVRNRPDERGELSIKLVLGRWYDPSAVQYWLYPDDDATLGKKDVAKWVKDRADALGWGMINGVTLLRDADRRPPEESILAAGPSPSPVRGFRSANTPGKSRMARAVAGDEDEEEEDGGLVEVE